MSTLAASALTLADWAKRTGGDGKVESKIAEILSQQNEILTDMVWQEGNLPTGHRMVVRTKLPTPSWRLLNQGVTPTKSATQQIDEGCAMLEDWSEVDVDVANLNGDLNAFRLSEATPHLEGMNQEFASTLLYGNADVDPEEFTGIAPRYASPTGDTGQNVIDAGGAGADNSSIYLVGWGPQTVFGVFPKGSKAGLVHEDLGLQTVQTGTGIATGRMRAYQDHWQWKAGLAVKDWRYIVRIGSIDISVLVADGAGATTKLIELMLKAIHRLPSQMGIRPAFYMNRTIFEMLDIQAMNKANVYLGIGQEEGRSKVTMRGIPCRLVDAATELETLV